MNHASHPFWIASGIFLSSLAASSAVRAQIVPDATEPVNSAVTPNGNTITITGGTVKGSNLFHSFEQFSLPTGTAAHFNNAPEIQNILTRVTEVSNFIINGLIQANGSANLFLLNPNGIIFGPNASLNIGCSFFASTASAVKFAGGSVFSAANPQNQPLLTVSVPVGLQFEANPGRILVHRGGGGIRTAADLADTSAGQARRTRSNPSPGWRKCRPRRSNPQNRWGAD